MGSSNSKPTTENNALLLCKERLKFIKQAIDSRDALSAAHLTYLQSLCSLGTSLRRFVETELLVESSISTSEVDKSPWHSSYASPSPSGFPEHVGSPSLSGSPLSPRLSNISYMRTTGSNAMTVAIDSSATHYVEDETLTFPLPPPPPPEIGSSWDFFDPADVMGNADGGQSLNFSRITCLRHLKEAEVVPLIEEENTISTKEKESKGDIIDLEESNSVQKKSCEDRGTKTGPSIVHESLETMVRIASSELCGPKEKNDKLKKELCAEREDPSEFITHRAKDLLSSMREIEHRFNRAAEAGKEVSRMLETNKIRLGTCTELIGNPPASRVLLALNRVCCKGNPSPKPEDSGQNVNKYITWKRSVSSLSSSSKTPLTSTAKDYACDSSSDFMDEFSMISGSHSSTLDRLYAWERKLYDEIKASEYIRKAYDQKCSQLRHQSAKDVKANLIDKTRAVVKDLHSRVRVAIQSVESISRRIEKLRDEELQPQLVELIQGLIRMSKAMLECHHAQFITISLAYLVKSSSSATQGEPYKQALIHLMNEMDCFNHSFTSWTNAHKTYVQALNSWLQQCILQPQAPRRKGRRSTFPPRNALAPPIFLLCSDWLAGLKSLPSEELCESIISISSVLHDSFDQLTQEKQVEKVSNKEAEAAEQPEKVAEEESKQEQNNKYSNLDSLRTGLTRLFDRLTKFSEASLKVHEDVKQDNEMARMAYTNAGSR